MKIISKTPAKGFTKHVCVYSSRIFLEGCAHKNIYTYKIYIYKDQMVLHIVLCNLLFIFHNALPENFHTNKYICNLLF